MAINESLQLVKFSLIKNIIALKNPH